MRELVPTEWMNMCMLMDKEHNRVLVQDKLGSWSGITFPGGHVEKGESFLDSIKREVWEETGLTVSQIELCGVIHWSHRRTHRKAIILLYRAYQFSGQLIDETEEGKVFWMDIDDLSELSEAKLAPNMKTYLEIFLGGEYHELYGEWDESGDDQLTLY